MNFYASFTFDLINFFLVLLDVAMVSHVSSGRTMVWVLGYPVAL
jgi:hypothetical protein